MRPDGPLAERTGMISPAQQDDDRQFEAALRPTHLDDFSGQPHVKENLKIAIEAANQRGDAMDHVLLCGPPGLGKTTLAGIIAQELGVTMDQTSGPVLQKKLDLTGVLTNVRPRQVFFVDEIHRLMSDVEEILYGALEDFRLDILIGTGPGARTHSMKLPRFTAVGATTRQGLLSAPLRSRFGLVLRLDPYDEATLTRIVERSGRLLEVSITPEGAQEIARRSRGTPRIANRLLRRVRDFAQVRANGTVDLDVAQAALNLLKVDRYGLDEVDQKIMTTVLLKYAGGPVGLSTIAASIDEQPDTIEEVYEPYLMQLGFLDRTPRGRVATQRAFEYFNVPFRPRFGGAQNPLF
jgi:Holliday junction DNA helicase RuvB